MKRPTEAIRSAIAEDKKEWMRIMASHNSRKVGDAEQLALDMLQNRMKECEDALKILNEFVFNPNPGS